MSTRDGGSALAQRVPLGFSDLPLGTLTRLITIFPELSDVSDARKIASPMSATQMQQMAASAGLTLAQVQALIQQALDNRPVVLDIGQVDARIGVPFRAGFNFDNLDSLGVSDVLPDDQIYLIDDSDANAIKRIDFGDLAAYFNDGEAIRDEVANQLVAGAGVELTIQGNGENQTLLIETTATAGAGSAVGRLVARTAALPTSSASTGSVIRTTWGDLATGYTTPCLLYTSPSPRD